MKSRTHLWTEQHGACWFCDGMTELARMGPARAVVAMLAREQDGGRRTRDNIVMSCKFCAVNREHAFAHDHRNEMHALIGYGRHPLHWNSLLLPMEAA